MCLPQGPWQETVVLEAAGPTEHIEGSLGMCVHVREKANSSCLRSGRPVLPGAQVCPHGRTRSSTHLRITRESPAALPHPADSLGTEVCGRGAVTCWAISTELLGPRRSSFSGEGNARKVETSAGGGEDSAEAGS